MIQKISRTTIAALITAFGLSVAAPAFATNIGNEGCTPGYWKNHTDNWEEYRPSQTLESVFDVPNAYGYDNVTLEQALAFRGGSGADGAARILLRAATAAVLNAAHEGIGYPYRRNVEPFRIIATVNAALASVDRQQMLDLAATLDAANNLGCPLN